MNGHGDQSQHHQKREEKSLTQIFGEEANFQLLIFSSTCTFENVTNSSKTKTKTERADELSSSNTDFGSNFASRFLKAKMRKYFWRGAELKTIFCSTIGSEIWCSRSRVMRF